MTPTSPPPRTGLLGSWDRFVGPSATAAENTLTLSSAALGTAFALWLLVSREASVIQMILGTLMAFDIYGGVVANATSAAKRWYHRPGRHWQHHFGFVLFHLVQIAVAAWIFRGGDVTFFAVFGVALLVSAGFILSAPRYLRFPIALALYTICLLLSLYAFTPTVGLEWIVPVLFLKLLVGHLIPETVPKT